MEDKIQTSIILDSVIKERIEWLAKNAERSVQAQIRFLINQEWERQKNVLELPTIEWK